MNSQTSKIALAVIITAVVVGGGMYLWQQQQAATPTPVVEENKPVVNQVTPTATTSSKPVITFPTAGSNVVGPKVTIKGTAKPNTDLWAYINYDASESIGQNSYANGGAGTVGADGKFTLDLAEPCSHNLTVVVVAVDRSYKGPEFYSSDYISAPVTFTTTGPLSGICTQ